MADTSHPTTRDLVLVPAIITLAVTALRLVGELQHWPSTLFNRAGESDRIKESIVSALGNVPTEENMKFLMDVASNQNEASSVRNTALRRITSRQNLTTDNLIKLYDATDNRSMRNSLVDALAQRPEPAALDKLLNIIKYSTDIEVRTNAIQELLRKNDKVITQKVLDLIGK